LRSARLDLGTRLLAPRLATGATRGPRVMEAPGRGGERRVRSLPQPASWPAAAADLRGHGAPTRGRSTARSGGSSAPPTELSVGSRLRLHRSRRAHSRGRAALAAPPQTCHRGGGPDGNQPPLARELTAPVRPSRPSAPAASTAGYVPCSTGSSSSASRCSGPVPGAPAVERVVGTRGQR
jgi:hypothetical protein